MKRTENIESLIKKVRYKASAQAYEKVLRSFLQALEDYKKQKSALTQSNILRIIMKSRITILAAAAVLLLGLFMLTIHLIGSETPQHTERTHKVTARQDENQGEAILSQVLLKRELETAKQLFERQDLPGLLQLLQTGLEPTKIQVAQYLGQIGDKSVLSALHTFATKWQGSEQENPFQDAIGAIQERQAKSKPPETATSQEPNEPQAPAEASQTAVAGIVVDKNTYRPIQEAEVGFRPTEAVVTDAEGRFQLAYEKPYEEASVCVTASGYASRRIVVRMKMGSTQNVTIELSPGSKLVGIVTGPKGYPIQGADVAIFGLTYFLERQDPAGLLQSLFFAVTDIEGRFEIDGLDPVVHSYQVLVDHPAYPAVSVGFPPAAAGQIRYQEIVLKPGVVVFGQVTNLQGAPVSGVTVGNTPSRSMWNCITTETDEDGMYRLGIVDVGELVLWATHGQYAPFVERTVLARSQAERCIDIQLKDARTLHGRVTDGDGNPIPEATVTTAEYNGVRNLDRHRHSCDSDGRFTITNAPADGELELRVFGEGITGTNRKVDLGQDECLIVVSRSGRIYGEVLDATTGEPIPRFLVKMTFSQVGPRTFGYAAKWSHEGYTFDSFEGLFDTGRADLPVNGQYRMTLHAEGYAPLTIDPVVVQPISDDPNRTKFTLQPATVFAGRLIASDGKPIKGATVVFFSNGNVQDRENWPRAVTDKAGIFTISGLGSEPQCVFVSAADFTPRVYLMTDLLETPGLLADIVLDRAASLFGRVLDENGKAMADARLHAFVDLGRARDVLKRFPSLGPRASTDKGGYYQLSGVPTGRVQVSVMSPRNYKIGSKKVDLKPGESMELNYGDEGGYVITGTVRAGNDILENAQVTLHSRQADPKNRYFNIRRTDQAGQFKLIHVPEGTYTLSVNWTPSHAHGTTKWPEDTKFALHRPLEIHKNMELEIDVSEDSVSGIGGGSVSGVVPEVLRSREGLSLTVMRQVTSPEDTVAPEEWRWTPVPVAKVGTDGRFVVKQLPPGQYYLVLNNSEKTLAISDIFKIAESEHLAGLHFHYGNGRMLIRVVDAGTDHSIPNAMFSIVNHLQTKFRDKRHAYTRDRSNRIMTVDEDGQCLYDDLPKGRYQVKADGYGYLLGQSAWVDIAEGQQTELTVRLEPAALVHFDLADAVRKQITKNEVLVSCKVKDMATQALVRDMNLWGESDYHYIRISPSESVDDVLSVLNLPEGTFSIDYTVRTMDVLDGVQVGPGKKVAQGKTTVTCQLRQVVTIVVAGQ